MAHITVQTQSPVVDYGASLALGRHMRTKQLDHKFILPAPTSSAITSTSKSAALKSRHLIGILKVMGRRVLGSHPARTFPTNDPSC